MHTAVHESNKRNKTEEKQTTTDEAKLTNRIVNPAIHKQVSQRSTQISATRTTDTSASNQQPTQMQCFMGIWIHEFCENTETIRVSEEQARRRPS